MSPLVYTPLHEIEKIHADLEATFKSGKLQDIEYRKYVLAQLGYLVKDNFNAIELALEKDLGRPPLESEFVEINPTIDEAVIAYENVANWSKPVKPAFSSAWGATQRIVYKEGKGVVLVIGAFNFPLMTGLNPVISAIAAGNTVVYKPSEMTPATSALLSELLPKYVDRHVIHVVNGSIPETTKLLELPYGHVMFTGSGPVGRIVAGAVAKTLTPVTLELGGKSPVIIDPKSCDLPSTARRILFGKTHNSGQICIAPDYVIVPRYFQDTLVEALKKAYDEFFPEGPFAHRAMSRMINANAYNRLRGLVEKTEGEIVVGGEFKESIRGIAPTIVKNCTWTDALMSQEIFGPVLPLIPVDDLEEGLAHVRSNDVPLAVYVFSSDKRFQDKIRRETQSGSILFNDVVLQAIAEGLPFGGVGPSGSGGYHNGKYGFDVFTHDRASMNVHPLLTYSRLDSVLSFRFPPYLGRTFLMKHMAPALPKRPKGPPTKSSSSYGASTWVPIIVALFVAGGVAAQKTKVLSR
ncbi:NAD-aldehyde dehydrogenase [Cylindrobasidium torrendii FP15055 ss-10]|uniref:Aldehyde dehydrogenase n=1 Tax=Cylindrobasidium torrendii FP15055 ss-10 TaxID=1314674 RepID=A0A0D7AZJ4_9AGAR|nr:NAD-aldehyde dehydrogenase [Cylindrobasidium torrendii FP15055 ss-10]